LKNDRDRLPAAVQNAVESAENAAGSPISVFVSCKGDRVPDFRVGEFVRAADLHYHVAGRRRIRFDKQIEFEAIVSGKAFGIFAVGDFRDQRIGSLRAG
jgi:hypothetical protein